MCFPSLSLPADQSERTEPRRPDVSTLAKGVLVSVFDQMEDRLRSRSAHDSPSFVVFDQSWACSSSESSSRSWLDFPDLLEIPDVDIRRIAASSKRMVGESVFAAMLQLILKCLGIGS